VRLDTEFDVLNKAAMKAAGVQADVSTTSDGTTTSATADSADASAGTKIVRVEFAPGTVAGLTLTANEQGPGVKIERLVKRDQAYVCGLRRGDTLVSVNNVPCTNAPAAVRIFEEATKAARPVVCVVLPKAWRKEARARRAADLASRVSCHVDESGAELPEPSSSASSNDGEADGARAAELEDGSERQDERLLRGGVSGCWAGIFTGVRNSLRALLLRPSRARTGDVA
jgi:hypothetical protein